MNFRLHWFTLLGTCSVLAACTGTTCESVISSETSLLQKGLVVEARNANLQAGSQRGLDATESVFHLIGLLGVACSSLMLAPQILLNYRNTSTAGLSAGLIITWHIGSLLATAYYLQAGYSAYVFVSMASLSLCCVVVEGQLLAYGPLYEGCSNAEKNSAVLKWTSSLMFFTVCSVASLAWIFDTTYWAGRAALGSSTLFLVAGFFPQLAQFIGEWSLEGYHLGVTFLDVFGSAFTAVVLLHEEGLSTATLKEAAPLLVIIAMHGLLLMVAAVITCTGPAPTDDFSDVLSEADELDRTLFLFTRGVTAHAFARSVSEDLKPAGVLFDKRLRTA